MSRTQARSHALAPVVLVLALGAAVLFAAATPATAQQPVAPPPAPATTALVAAEPAPPAPATPGTRPPSGRGEDGSIIVSGPQRTGRAEPTILQRVADTLLWGWLLLALIGGPLLWWWTGRPRRALEASSSGPPGPTAR